MYDDFNRLITSTCNANCPQNPSGLAFNYVYDRYGNRWQQNVTAGKGTGPQYIFSSGNNQITGSGVVYDAAGNVMNDGLGNTFTYDGENRISSVNDHASIYVYDAEGLRVRKTTGGASVDYIFDLSGHQVAEVSSSGGWNRGEVYAGGRHLATYSGGTSGTIYFPYTDWLGTERARATETGTVCESITSLPYGDMQNITGSCGDPSPMHFTGKQRDTETGLDDFGARYYSSVQGRWYSPDWASAQVPVPYADLHNPQTLNLYDYVGGDPTNHADADGHISAKPGDSGDAAENGGCPSTYSYASCAGAAKPQTPAQNHGFWWNLGHALGIVQTEAEKKAEAAAYQQAKTTWEKGHPGQSYAWHMFNLQMGMTPMAGFAAVGEAEEAGGIIVSAARLTKVLQAHTEGGLLSAGKSLFGAGEDVGALIQAANSTPAVAQAGGNFERIVDAGRIIGTDRATGAATSIYTVITDSSGNMITAFPGKP
ncbi:MAG: RHS repeat-associated core domain-containing protein [Candidatus Sulfotelmatobacter sp.]